MSGRSAGGMDACGRPRPNLSMRGRKNEQRAGDRELASAEDYDEAMAGMGGRNTRASTLTLRLTLAGFGVVVCALLGAVRLVGLVVVAGKRHEEPG